MTADSRLALAILLLTCAARAEDDLQNHGYDPLFQISSGTTNYPEPAGPRITEAKQEHDSHHRVEHDNRCWAESRYRLPNVFSYDGKITETTKQRL